MEGIAEALGATTTKARALMAGEWEPPPSAVFKLEDLLQVPPGSLSHLLGYLPATVPCLSVEEVISRETLVDEEARDLVLGIWRAVSAGRAPPSGSTATGTPAAMTRQRSTRRATSQYPFDLSDLAVSFGLYLRSEGRATATVSSYLTTLRQFQRFLEVLGRPTRVASVGEADVRAYLANILSRASVSTATLRYSALRRFFRWAADEGEIPEDPMSALPSPASWASTRSVSGVPRSVH